MKDQATTLRQLAIPENTMVPGVVMHATIKVLHSQSPPKPVGIIVNDVVGIGDAEETFAQINAAAKLPKKMVHYGNYTKESCHKPARKDRVALVENHLQLVKFIAERLAAKLPPWVDLDDLIGAGMLGLLDAVDKFDPQKGVMFRTYAEMRVRGAILDSLRDLDWAPRSLRRRAREVEAAYLQLEQIRGYANEEDVAAILGLSLGQFQTLLGELRGLTVTGLDAGDDDEDGQTLKQFPQDSAHSPLALFERTEERECMTMAVERLPQREKQVVALYYVEELTMKEIGAALGVTESRVSQIHTQAVLRLRASLGAMKTNLALAV